MAKKRLVVCLVLVSAQCLLAGCSIVAGLSRNANDPSEAEWVSVVDVTVTQSVPDLGIGGITDIYVVQGWPRDVWPAITVVGLSGIAVLDDDLNVRERFSFQNSRQRSKRKLIDAGENGIPIIVSRGEYSKSDLIEAHDLRGNHLWSRRFSFQIDFVDAFRCKDGRYAVCVAQTDMKHSYMAIVGLNGEELFNSALSWVNSDDCVAVFDIGDGDRLWFGSHNKVIAINELGDRVTHSVGARSAWVNGVEDYRLLGETREKAILFSYSQPVGLIGFRHKQRNILFVGESMEDLRREKVVSETMSLGRSNGTKLDTEGRYWARYYQIFNQSNNPVIGQCSGSMMISTAEGTFAGRHDFAPMRIMESGGDDGAMAIIERHPDYAIALAGKGKTLWVTRIDFPPENATVESQRWNETAGDRTTSGDRR